ncbi:uncharacterized protein LOC119294446 isoform X3 [Triticum dicoccoides]|uniref:uncharacterized protein LOC119294446 isoform X3 n=1 Tax=Triticum dicoccoides TaxID=85692 RepID=UPI00188EFCD3|nr:uncharacterized protein LOC119294446 isoform X3 [Triticum dicoccoides]
MEEEFISLGDESCVAPTPKDKDGIIHLQVQQNQFQAVHLDIMDAPPPPPPPQTQTQPQDNVDINANAASSCVPVEIPKGRTTESAVRLVYTNLTRESKRKLMELMQQWSHCQATRITNQPNSYSTVEDMDLSDDNNVLLVTKHGVSAEMGKRSGPEAALVHASRTSSALIDQSPTRGDNRAPTESTEPSVSLVYNNLTRESKRELMELMQQWSEWQATKQPNSTESAEQVLDCGEETYYPAIHVGSERPCAVVCTDNHSGWIITKHEKMLLWMWMWMWMMARCPCTIENLHWVIHQMLRARKKMRRMVGGVSTVLHLVMLSRTAQTLTTMFQLAWPASR